MELKKEYVVLCKKENEKNRYIQTTMILQQSANENSVKEYNKERSQNNVF